MESTFIQHRIACTTRVLGDALRARAIRSYLHSLALPPIPLLSYRLRELRPLRAALGKPPAAVAALRAGARPFGLRHALSAAVREPCPRSLRSLRAAPLPGPPLRRSHGLRSRPRTRSGWRRLGGENYATPTCCLIVPRVLPPPTLRVLRCAPARGGSARHRAGATVAQAQPPLRPAKTQAKLRQGLAPAPSPRRDAKLHQPRVAAVRARVPKRHHIGDRPRNVKPIERRST